MPGFEVDCKNVVFSPSGQPELRILNGVDLKVAGGEFLGIVGANGTGKSTLLAAIAGELELADGKITVGGRSITGPINRRIDSVGIVHQNDEDDLLHAYSIAMNVAFRQANNGCHRGRFWACSQKYRSWLAKEIADRAQTLRADVDQLVGHLSGGNRQILNLVISIHLEHERNPCRLVLLDEHTARLDHENAARVMTFTGQQVKETRSTAIMVTHRYADAIEYCDRVVVMGEGKIKRVFAGDDMVRLRKCYQETRSTDELAVAVEDALTLDSGLSASHAAR